MLLLKCNVCRAQLSEAPRGEVMIWALSEKLKEWLTEHNKPRLTAHEAMMEKIEAAKEEEEQKRIEV